MSTFHQFSARKLSGEQIDFKHYAGKLVLVVNTASKCGFTPQYAGLEALYQRYREHGLEILGFPCNQFGAQEPGGKAEIEASCLINYGVSFPIFEKVEVKGPGAHPLFAYLSRSLPGLFGRKLRWNFTKFLIAPDGTPLQRFAPITAPAKLEQEIRKRLGLAA
jgi:glutathione peroxidase